MTLRNDISEGFQPLPEGQAPLVQIVTWHVIWTVVVLLGALGVNAAADGLSVPLMTALSVILLPPLFAVASRPGESETRQITLLALWAACGAIAALLTGGMGGPLGVWCLAPLALAGLLGGRRVAALAAVVSVLAVIVVVFVQVAGEIPAAPVGMVSFALGVTAVVSLLLGLGMSIAAYRRRAQVVPEVAAPPAPPPIPKPDDDARRILNAQPNRLLVLEPDGRISAAFGPFNMPPAQGQSILAAARPDDHAAILEAVRAARSGERQSLGFVSASDLDRHLTLDLRPLDATRLVGVLRDSTETRDREETLDAARIEAESLAAGKSRFLAGMSHELRTPLNAIMGFSDIMRNEMFGELKPRYQEYAQLIHESGAHLLDLINDVLDMSKIEAQRYELNTEIFDPREPVSAALRIVRAQADEAGVRLRATLPAKTQEVEADRRAIKQIVLNLVSNALKFTPREGSVIVGIDTKGRDLIITVADTGIGIAPEDVERLGKPYEQAGDARGRSKGTGLGLSLVRAFAELHGGQMVIESRLGEGTAVTVIMPVVVAEPEQPANGYNVLNFKTQR